ncbi:MAG: flagellar biosynthesis protein FlhF [Bryobacteraceae bacterium]
MRLKSYFANTVEAAVGLARRELGPETMLVHSREATAETRHLGRYEVVFAVEDSPAVTEAMTTAAETNATEAPAETAQPAPWGRLAQEVSDLRRQVERIVTVVSTSSPALSPQTASQPELAKLYSLLVAEGLDPELARQVVVRAQEKAAERGSTVNAAEEALDSLFRVDPSIGRTGASRRVIAVVGAPGVGKTTTLVKLAACYGLQARRPAQILSADTVRIGAADQLRSYAAILGIGFQTVETARAVAQALEEHRYKELILIDTPGFGARDMEEASALAYALSTHPEIDVHLVLTACAKSADLLRAAERFDIFQPRKLIFTRLDETGSLGSLLNTAAMTGKPISFLANGQLIPEDLEPAAKEKILGPLFGRTAAQAVAAA